MEFNGSGATLIVEESKITIRRKGLLSFMAQGSKGDKVIYIKSISAIQLKKPRFSKGFIQFSMSGESASHGGTFSAVTDENSIMIANESQYKAFVKAKELIESYLHAPKNESVSKASLADELEKLGNLVAKGILTQGEFEIQKAKLLNN
jgi:hypothetical protein